MTRIMGIKSLPGAARGKVHKEGRDNSNSTQITLHESVTIAMHDYFSCLDGEDATDIYQMVISQVESALLTAVMRQVGGNKSKAAGCLGISRGTLLKKLTQYKLHPCRKRGKQA